MEYVEEVAPLTEEQWERLINWYRRTARPHLAQGLVEAKQFRTSMQKIQSQAGQSHGQFGEMIRALLDMAQVEPPKYHYRLSCPDCTDIDPQGCFDGGTWTSEAEFDTPQEAMKAGYKATLRNIYTFEVVDEAGAIIEVEES